MDSQETETVEVVDFPRVVVDSQETETVVVVDFPRVVVDSQEMETVVVDFLETHRQSDAQRHQLRLLAHRPETHKEILLYNIHHKICPRSPILDFTALSGPGVRHMNRPVSQTETVQRLLL